MQGLVADVRAPPVFDRPTVVPARPEYPAPIGTEMQRTGPDQTAFAASG